ncbi:MAG: hypothetical protein AB8B70_07690 [Prochlorococcus sp.]
MSIKEKREEVKARLNDLRKDLRLMHQGVSESQTNPDPGDVRTAMTKLEELLALLETKSSRKPKA